ncbi:MAG: cupin domain-containing protein [Euryarchaeota archaeon]
MGWELRVERNRRETVCGRVLELYSDERLSLAEVEVDGDGEEHYHERITEVYYVLEGTGRVHLNGRPVDVRPGDVVVVRPGVRHKVEGRMRLLVACSPPFDPEDVHAEG